MRITTVAITSILVGSATLTADSRKIDFSSDTVGLPPKGFEFGLTAKAGAPGRWVVQADGGNKVLAQLDADATRSRFPVAVVADVTTAEGDLICSMPADFRQNRSGLPVWSGDTVMRTTTTSSDKCPGR